MASFRFELSDAENRKLAVLAKRTGVSKAAFIRMMLERMPDVSDEEEKEIQRPKAAKVTIRLTQAQADELKKRAKADNRTPTSYASQLLTGRLAEGLERTDVEPMLKTAYQHRFEGSSKCRQINIRLTPAQADELKKRANAENKTPTTWVRWIAQANLAKEPVYTDKDRVELRNTSEQLSRVGRNINQIAKAMNIDPRNSQIMGSLDWGKVGLVVSSLEQEVENMRTAAQRRWAA